MQLFASVDWVREVCYSLAYITRDDQTIPHSTAHVNQLYPIESPENPSVLVLLFPLCCNLFTLNYQVRITVRDVQVEREEMRGDEQKLHLWWISEGI
jgi:hypothetical protein